MKMYFLVVRYNVLEHTKSRFFTLRRDVNNNDITFGRI